MPHGHDHALIWSRFTFAESSAFNKILSGFWNQMDANSDSLPVVEYKGSKEIQVGMGRSSELSFEFTKFAPRFDNFVYHHFMITMVMQMQTMDLKVLTMVYLT